MHERGVGQTDERVRGGWWLRRSRRCHRRPKMLALSRVVPLPRAARMLAIVVAYC